MANTAASVVETAGKEVGYTRWDDPKTGTKYGRWYAKKTGNAYYGANGVPYCAMFVSWVFDQCKAKAVGIPGAYCPSILSAARKKGKTVAVKNAKKGDLVLFDWNHDGVADHIGIVVFNTGSHLKTIEGNTSSTNQSNGGTVARRVRAYSTVIGIIRPDYKKSSKKKDEPKPSKAKIVKYKVVAKNGLNVRKGPGTKYKKVTMLQNGAVVKSSEKRGDWVKISSGWCSAKYLKKM